MDKVQVIILAAGKGTRMNSDEPKALTNFKGKPFLTHILETLKELNFSLPPVIVIGHKKERIIEVLGNANTFAYQREQLGTGHAVVSAKETLDPSHEIILVISTDQPLVSKETILALINKHRESKPMITLATVTLPDFSEWRTGLTKFGRIIRNETKKLKGIIEFKDATGEEKNILEVNPALYVFDKNWLWANIGRLNKQNAQGEYYLTDLIKLASLQGAKIETVSLANILEIIQPNTKEELEILEKLAI